MAYRRPNGGACPKHQGSRLGLWARNVRQRVLFAIGRGISGYGETDLSPLNSKQDLHDWCKDAHEKRHERNMYMHGQWAFLPHLEEAVEFTIAPWMKEKYAGIYPGTRFSLSHLEMVVSDLQSCFKSLQSLRRKYGI